MSASWMLALLLTAHVANAAASGTLLRPLSLARRGVRDGLRIQRHVTKLAQQTPNATAEHPDVVAKDQFMRECTVVSSSTKKEMLPLNVLDKICDSTDAVVECKQAITKELSDTFDQGGSVWRFCGSAYEWFQKKYGMHCPKQCHKLQCRATCAWLKDKKEHDLKGETLREEVEKVSADKSELKALEQSVKEQEGYVLKANRSLEQAVVDVGRANETFVEELAAFEQAKKRAEEAAASVDKREAATEALKANMSKTEEALTALQFKIDKAKLKHATKEREVKKAAEKLDEVHAAIEETETKMSEDKEGIAALEKIIADDEKKIQEFDEIITMGNETTKKNMAKYEKAKSNLETMQKDVEDNSKVLESKKGNASMSENATKAIKAMLAEQEDLVKQMQERVKSSESKVRKLSQRRHKIHRHVQVAKTKLATLKAALLGLGENLAKQKALANTGNSSLATAREEAASMATALAAQEAEAEALKASLASQGKALDTALATGKSVKEVQQERDDALKEAKEKAVADKDALALAEGKQDKAETARDEALQELAERRAKVSELEHKWEADHGDLAVEVAAHKNATKDLERRKPDIVRQHSLGLWQMMGFF